MRLEMTESFSWGQAIVAIMLPLKLSFLLAWVRMGGGETFRGPTQPQTSPSQGWCGRGWKKRLNSPKLCLYSDFLILFRLLRHRFRFVLVLEFLLYWKPRIFLSVEHCDNKKSNPSSCHWGGSVIFCGVLHSAMVKDRLPGRGQAPLVKI